MAGLHLTAEHDRVRVRHGQAASAGVVVSGWTGSTPPAIAADAGAADRWVSIVHGAGGRSVVSFGRSADGRHPRPGSYRVVVSAQQGAHEAWIPIEFVVERHPCLQIGPKPSLSWNPATGMATLKVSMWSCGNVDLDVSWSVHVDGNRIEMRPAKVTLFADGGPVDTTLTFSVPGGLDADTEIDVEALSEDAPKSVFSLGPSWLRRNRRRLVAPAVIAVLVVGLVGLAIAVNHTNDEVVVADTVAPPVAITEAPSTTTRAKTTTTATTEPTTEPSPAKLALDGDAQATIETAAGTEAGTTFSIVNRGGRTADVTAAWPVRTGYFSVADACTGALEPDRACTIGVDFAPAKAGKFEIHVFVKDHTTDHELALTVTGIATTVDLTPEIDADPWRFTNCPSGAKACFVVTVKNLGTGPSPATTATIDFASGKEVKTASVPAIEKNQSAEIVVASPCLRTCRTTVTVDPDGKVVEAAEDNNVVSWRPGPE